MDSLVVRYALSLAAGVALYVLVRLYAGRRTPFQWPRQLDRLRRALLAVLTFACVLCGSVVGVIVGTAHAATAAIGPERHGHMFAALAAGLFFGVPFGLLAGWMLAGAAYRRLKLAVDRDVATAVLVFGGISAAIPPLLLVSSEPFPLAGLFIAAFLTCVLLAMHSGWSLLLGTVAVPLALLMRPWGAGAAMLMALALFHAGRVSHRSTGTSTPTLRPLWTAPGSSCGTSSATSLRGGQMANTNDTHNPDNAATDPAAAAKQDQVKRDHDVLEESARRVEASVPAHVRDTPVQPAESTDDSTRNSDDARRNADAARDSARRVDESIPAGQERGPR